ncbi:MAG TPA: phospho-N-acetylmuramoyl-pentapeptide-transferase [Atribacterota bacterium]|mgnify:CR=1 FL=1|nr:phospho-N-acetylmuramoyl-pentapeptide-transferase [Atribacterota bacterium]HPK86469.1 phospho-N-acetylmuramoyl-pentapeptide-transferase [Atribacterota bacterium]
MLRVAVTLFIAFFVPILLTPLFIRIQKRYDIGQRIRTEGPDLHQHKTGTPTMGGSIIFLAVALSLGYFHPEDSRVYASFALLLSFGLVGLIDDLIKFYKDRSLGLKARNKIALQFTISILFLYWLFQNNLLDKTIIVPFQSNLIVTAPLFYIPFTILVLLSTTNAVNLSDGLDGLATGLIIIAMLAFAKIAFAQEKESLGIFALIMIFSCAGFLVFNFHPAKIFLGDVGALGLGGALAAIGVFSNAELFLLIIGGVFVLETSSVIIQVISIKWRQKPVFLMSPLHHHFEMKKWKEVQIVALFWGLGLIFAVLGLMAYPFK